MILSLATFVQLAVSCGPSVHPDTLAAVARTESRFHTAAINDNTDGGRYFPGSVEEAVNVATELITTKRHSVDLGLMQINSTNLPGLGMTIADTFDACKNIRAGARVLVSDYRPELGENAQSALLRALSRYNTGHAERGFSNGYVTRVQASAQQIVPAIRLLGAPTTGQGQGEATPAAPATPPLPPAWDVFGQARYARQFGSTRASDLPAAPKSATTQPAVPPAQLQPVQLQTATRVAGDDR